MKPNLEFPASIPNDIEGYMVYFPKKFPLLLEQYEKLVAKYWDKPKELDEYCKGLIDELWTGYGRIKKDFQKTPKEKRTLKFLINIDERLQKLNCYRFWIVNYALCEGPLNNYFIEELQKYVHELVENEDEDTETEEREKLLRLLLKGDYKDLYVINALGGLHIYKSLKECTATQELCAELENKIGSVEDKELYKIVDKILEKTSREKNNSQLEKFFRHMKEPLDCSSVKGDLSVVYVTIIQAIEFNNKNVLLQKEYRNIKNTLKEVFRRAEDKLSKEDFKKFILAYTMLMKFKKFKDDFGEIDSDWLPLWLSQLIPELREHINDKSTNLIGQGSVFYHFAWLLPPYLLKQVFKPDNTPFEVSKA